MGGIIAPKSSSRLLTFARQARGRKSSPSIFQLDCSASRDRAVAPLTEHVARFWAVFVNPASFLRHAGQPFKPCRLGRPAKSSKPTPRHQKKLSRQTFNILAKIREVDAVALRFEGLIFECHPEVSFWAMNARQPMRLPKKPSRRKNPDSESGLRERRQLLLRNGYDAEFLTTCLGLAKGSGPDDFVDACAAAWTAERILNGRAVRFPRLPDVDAVGLDMAIWA